MKPTIYLDNNASTALDPRVLQAVVASLETAIGNSSSIHSFGQETRNQLNKARRTVADYLGVKPQEVIFTSGGSEGINMTIRGVCGEKKGHLITSTIEHSAVHNTVKYLEERGCEVSWLSPGLSGKVSPQQVKSALRPDTRLIVLSAANNETGAKIDMYAIAQLAHDAKVPFIVDAVAYLGKEPIYIPAGVSAMCFSGHKIHAPKGVGAAYIRQSLKLDPLIVGAHQENNRRAGTENIPGIIGFAEAVAILKESPETYSEIQKLRDHFEAGLKARLSNVVVNGEGERLTNTSNLSFLGVDGEALLMQLDRAGIAVSHGAACSSGALQPSRVLLNMGIPMAQARSTLRFSLSRFTTQHEIDTTIDVICGIIGN